MITFNVLEHVDPVAEARFFAKTIPEPNTGCLLWTSGVGPSGHGRACINRVSYAAHRVAWTIANGPVPYGLCVLHRCDTPACVNAEHLFLGTHSDNEQDKLSKGRHWAQRLTHCKRGHEFTPDNTMTHSESRGVWRECRECKRQRNAARYVIPVVRVIMRGERT